MYNRYIPQPDGSYHRNAMQEPQPPKPPEPPCPPPAQPVPHKGQPYQEMNSCQNPSIGSFFRRLLPKDFCTEDLLIILLLLLMTGERKEDQNFALLTLALYLFL